MCKQVEEYQSKKAADLEVTKAKIVAKQKKDETKSIAYLKWEERANGEIQQQKDNLGKHRAG